MSTPDLESIGDRGDVELPALCKLRKICSFKLELGDIQFW